jgi:hypothetical protein
LLDIFAMLMLTMTGQVTVHTASVPQLDVHARILLQEGRLAEAQTTYTILAARTKGTTSYRYETLATILGENPGGVYRVAARFPARTTPGDPPARHLTPGPASLVDPLVLQAALHEKATQKVRTAREYVAIADETLTKNPTVSTVLLLAAVKTLDQADTLVKGIAVGERPEVRANLLAARRVQADRLAQEFDGLLSKFEQTPEDDQGRPYQLEDMTDQLNHLQNELQAILELTRQEQRHYEETTHLASRAAISSTRPALTRTQRVENDIEMVRSLLTLMNRPH